MKLLKNVKVVAALILVLVAIGVWIGIRSHVPSSEITRSEMLQFLEKKLITRAAVTPLIYQGIYNVEGSYTVKPGAASKKFFITTHLDQAQVNALLEQSNVKV